MDITEKAKNIRQYWLQQGKVHEQLAVEFALKEWFHSITGGEFNNPAFDALDTVYSAEFIALNAHFLFILERKFGQFPRSIAPEQIINIAESLAVDGYYDAGTFSILTTPVHNYIIDKTIYQYIVCRWTKTIIDGVNTIHSFINGHWIGWLLAEELRVNQIVNRQGLIPFGKYQGNEFIEYKNGLVTIGGKKAVVDEFINNKFVRTREDSFLKDFLPVESIIYTGYHIRQDHYPALYVLRVEGE